MNDLEFGTIKLHLDELMKERNNQSVSSHIVRKCNVHSSKNIKIMTFKD